MEIGMLVTLSSFGMLFGTLILSYFLARARSPVWPPMGIDPIAPLLPSLSTVIILIASYFTEKSLLDWRMENRKSCRANWKAALISTLLFLFFQVAVWQ